MNDSIDNGLTIGQVAKMLGISVETIRFYERKELIEQPPRPNEGYRLYPHSTIDRIRFIRSSQANGFSLEDINELLSFDQKDCDAVMTLAQKSLSKVQRKIDQLKRLENSLESVIETCSLGDHDQRCHYLISVFTE